MAQKKGELTGKTIAGYELQEPLGSGGMATVYLARQQSIGRTVAIKVMPTHLLNDRTFIKRFQNEVNVIADLQHPRVLPVFDYGEFEGRPFIIMAHIDGGTLGEKIEQGPMTSREVNRLITQIAEGLDHAHGMGIIHRDFKPSNVLLDKNGNAYLADFGIAKLSEQATNLTGSGVIGTPAYMAPEMAQNGDVTAAIDIYALGVTLYEMLTGRFPFDADTAIRMMMAHVNTPIPDVRDVRPELPSTVRDVVAKAMAKHPEERYEKATDLAVDLRAALAGQPVKAPEYMPPDPIDSVFGTEPQTRSQTPTPPPPPPDPQPAQKRRRGFPVLLVGGGIIGVLALVGIIGLAAAGILGGGGGTCTPAEGSSCLRVVNNTDLALCGIFIDEDESFADNLIEGAQVSPNDVFDISPLSAGVYNVKANDCSGGLLDARYNIGIDGANRWTIEQGRLTINNASSRAFCEVNIRPSGANEWGANQLGVGQQLQPGAERSIVLGQSNWDMRAVPCDGSAQASEMGVAVGSDITWTISD